MSFVIKKYIIHPGMSTTQNNTISHPKTLAHSGYTYDSNFIGSYC